MTDEEDGSEPFAQVRMTAMIENIGPAKPDPDNGQTYGRFLTAPEKAAQLLNWGQVGNDQVYEAVSIARKKFGITRYSDEETLISGES